MKSFQCTVLFLSVCLVSSAALAGHGPRGKPVFQDYEWTEINAWASWEPRAGLEAVVMDGDFFILGGRTPNPWVPPPDGPLFGDSTLHGDVWRSPDRGETWVKILDTDDTNAEQWAARAYHEVVTRDDRIFLMGGQNFILEDNPACDFDPSCFPKKVPASDFFNDVWSSEDGENWVQLMPNAPWHERAGLSAIVFNGEIFVMGGSFNDTPEFGAPVRILYNDVWSSTDGVNWTLLTDDAPWAPRAGAALVVKNGYVWLLGGEFGFTGFPPPYFNDVWRTKDGENWELVTASAGWSPRPGHTCDVLRNTIVCFGGFGQSDDPSDPFKPSNPMDVWVSENGADWEQVSDSPWNALFPVDIKYDYDTVVAPAGPEGRGLAIYTFGGDRETFDFFDPTQWLNVDNDVWRYYLPKNRP